MSLAREASLRVGQPGPGVEKHGTPSACCWRELQADGTRPQRKKTIGDVKRFPTKSDVQREVENLRSEINARQELIGKLTIRELWGDFQVHELRSPHADRSLQPSSATWKTSSGTSFRNGATTTSIRSRPLAWSGGCILSHMRPQPRQSCAINCRASTATRSGMSIGKRPIRSKLCVRVPSGIDSRHPHP